MSLAKLKPCCKDSLAQGMDYCLQCGTRLQPDETTIIAARPNALSHTNRSLYFGMALVCLLVFGAIVAADYFVQRRAHQAAVIVTPSPIYTPSPFLRATPKPAPTQVPKTTPNPYDAIVRAASDPAPRRRSKRDILEGGLVDRPDLESYLDPPAAKPASPVSPDVAEMAQVGRDAKDSALGRPKRKRNAKLRPR